MMDIHRERKVTWLVLGLFFLGLMVVGLAIHNSNKKNQQAVDKANQLTAELTRAGLTAPDAQQIYDVLGDDGGAVCAAPANALVKSILYGTLTNGAAGPGQRPVVVDSKATKGVLLVVKVYCPDKAAGFQDMVNNLKYADVAG